MRSRRRELLASSTATTRGRPPTATRVVEVLDDAGHRGGHALRLSDVRALLGRHLAGRPTRANFRTGTLTVCTMVPMRSVPHRVVCLVGLDDGSSRGSDRDGDDVLARQPMTGERDIRSEDRQLLLDAISAATETLVITYTGATNTPASTGHPRSAGRAARHPGPVRRRAVRDTHRGRTSAAALRHSNVIPGTLDPQRPFTFDPTVLWPPRAAAVTAPSGHHSSAPLPAPAHGDVALADLIGFFRDPVKGFFGPWTSPCRGMLRVSQTDARRGRCARRSGASATGCCHDMLRGMRPDDARQRRMAPRHPCRRGIWVSARPRRSGTRGNRTRATPPSGNISAEFHRAGPRHEHRSRGRGPPPHRHRLTGPTVSGSSR